MAEVTKVVGILVGVIAGVLILLMVILIPVSIRDVDATEFAVEYLEVERKIANPEVLTEGRYIRAPSTVLYKYKRTLQTLNLFGQYPGKWEKDDVWCLTSEGLNMELDLIGQYQIQKESVFDIFKNWGQEANWKKYLMSLLSRVAIDVCSNYTGEDFYFYRGQIEKAILDQGKLSFAESSAYATLELVQLRNVYHPPLYTAANRDKQAVDQEKDRLLAERNQKLTDIETKRLEAIADAQIALTRARGVEQATLVFANITSQAEIQKWKQRAAALVAVKQELGNISNAELLDQYVRYISLVDQKSPVIAVN